MNEKKTIQNIIEILSEKQGMDKKDAELFVKGMFDLIEEALATEKYVKVKGLGTFKLTEVDSRASVDVNTGERIEIQGHTKISFTPDTTMKELINKPFSHFETVMLNEGVLLEDTPVVDEEVKSEDVADEMAELLDELQDLDSGNVLIAAAYFHAKFENIHPFADGNGRTGRLAMNYLLVMHNHPPVTIHEEDRKEYYEALEAWDRDQDLKPLRAFLQSQTEKTWEKQIQRAQRKDRQGTDHLPGFFRQFHGTVIGDGLCEGDPGGHPVYSD